MGKIGDRDSLYAAMLKACHFLDDNALLKITKKRFFLNPHQLHN